MKDLDEFNRAVMNSKTLGILIASSQVLVHASITGVREVDEKVLKAKDALHQAVDALFASLDGPSG